MGAMIRMVECVHVLTVSLLAASRRSEKIMK